MRKGSFLPDNSQIPWDSTKAIKQVVENYGKQFHLTEVTTSSGQLEELKEPSLILYEAELGKRTRSGKEY
ncbi:hypothetical protein VP01_219g8 [Puccinia sorghi]|uniref:Uncharacterized protein n=1 Tax=Puccinia sorghi TaxID=27349 RepID=A0A0L6V9M2_9BASI|nr:hypothetical protein VP01_219g8 [Puccinia sorghi]